MMFNILEQERGEHERGEQRFFVYEVRVFLAVCFHSSSEFSSRLSKDYSELLHLEMSCFHKEMTIKLIC